MWQRYLLAEIVGTVTCALGFAVVFILTENNLLAAYTAAILENPGFYGTILLLDLRQSDKKIRAQLLHMVAEFGPAELLDTLVIRPAALFYIPLWLGTDYYFVVLAKLVADLAFYLCAALSTTLFTVRSNS